LLQRAKRGDLSAPDLLRQALDEAPDVWRQKGDLARKAERSWATLVSGGDPAVGESVKRCLEELKAELAGPEPTALEALIVARIAVSFLQLHAADLEVANAQVHTPESFAYLDHLQRRQGQAQRRYLEAIRALGTLRKLERRTPSPLELVRPVSETVPGPPATGRGRRSAARAEAVAN
jgi:hypothetical protein